MLILKTNPFLNTIARDSFDVNDLNVKIEPYSRPYKTFSYKYQ